jgi:hypothetical protein
MGAAAIAGRSPGGSSTKAGAEGRAGDLVEVRRAIFDPACCSLSHHYLSMECNADMTGVGIGGPAGVDIFGTVYNVTHRWIVYCL